MKSLAGGLAECRASRFFCKQSGPVGGSVESPLPPAAPLRGGPCTTAAAATSPHAKVEGSSREVPRLLFHKLIREQIARYMLDNVGAFPDRRKLVEPPVAGARLRWW